MLTLLRRLQHLPRLARLSFAYANAVEDVKEGRYLSAKRKLLDIHERSPSDMAAPAPINLLLALVYLRLGDAVASADMALKGILQARSLVRFINHSEQAYMSYAGKLIYERATMVAGTPRTIDVGVELADLRFDGVRDVLREQFPLAEFAPVAGSALH